MADEAYNADQKASDSKTASDWDEVHAEALKEYDRAYQRERANMDDAYEDLRFRRGRLEDQWDANALAQRQGRPCHVVNKLPQFIRQVTGDMRQMRPSIKVVPVDSRGDQKVAEVRGGMIRYVENRSNAKHVYTIAADSQVSCGIGHWKVDTEYADSTTFNQEIRIRGIEDSVSVLWDADSLSPTRDDAGHCFEPNDMSRALLTKRWPDAQANGFTIPSGGAFNNWSGEDFVRVVAYWKKKPIKRTLVLFPDGSIDDITDQVEGYSKEQLKGAFEYMRTQRGARVEQRDSFKVCRYLMTLSEILEESEWPGMNIPIVPVLGEEVRIGREVYRHGIVRYARDLQRMVNYYSSAETEVIALQPKAPWIGTEKQFKDHLDIWETANTQNHPFLMFTPDTLSPGPPQRVPPPAPSQAIQLGGTNASENMKAVIGIYDASLGAKSNETSGVAIERRQREGDTGTFVYIDNFALAIQRTGQIINDLIPHIYDTQRQMRIIGEDGKPDVVDINRPYVADGADKVENDVTVGAYDVMIEQGPSYMTRRQEARDGMTAFIQAFPPAAPLIGDLYAKSQDWPYAEQISERLEEALPPAIKRKLDEDRKKREMADGQEPQISPEEAAAAQQQQIQQQVAQRAMAADLAAKEAAAKKAIAEAQKAEADARRAEADAQKAEIERDRARIGWSGDHMDQLRKIESHDEDMRRGGERHEADMARRTAPEPVQ